MTFEEIERLAFEGKPIGAKSEPHEILLYGAMSGLYSQYRAKQITRNMARQQKLECKRAFERAQWLHEKQLEAYNAHQANICIAAGSLCAIERTAVDCPAEDVLDWAIKCIGAMVGDGDMYRRFKKKRAAYYGRLEI